MNRPMHDVLESHINRPYNNRLLPVAHGRATIADGQWQNAVKIMFTVDRHQRILDVGFRVYGDRVLAGCASFLTEVVRGQSLRLAEHLTPTHLAEGMRVPPDDQWCAVMSIHALWAAVSDYRSRCPVFTDRPYVRGPRRALFPPQPTDHDRQLIRQGQNLWHVMAERTAIVRALTNFDLCLQIGMASHRLGDESVNGRLQRMVRQFPEADRLLVQRLGLRGLSVFEAAMELGEPPQVVHDRLWDLGHRTQRQWHADRRSSAAMGVGVERSAS